MVPIKYIGHRPRYRDGAFGSGLEFVQGETRLVDAEVAVKMLRHPSVYERGDAAEAVNAPAVQPVKSAEDDDDPAQTLRDAISQMNKEALAMYAKSHFNVDLDKREKVGDLRSQVITLFDQYGVE